MSRIAFCHTGWTDTLSDIDERCFYPFGDAIGTSSAAPGIFLDNLTSFATYWNYSTLLFAYSLTIDGVLYTNSGASGPSGGITEERDLICVGSAPLFEFSDLPTFDGTLFMDAYDPITKDFHFSASFGGNPAGGGQIYGTTQQPGWLATGVSCTVLGQPETIYVDPAHTITGSIDITVESYWPYDDGTVNSPSNPFGGPIYDSVTGANILGPPVPTGLYGA